MTEEGTLLLVERIRRYVVANPEAVDTVDGIRRHWLEPGTASVEGIQIAITVLVERGFLGEKADGDGRIQYYLVA